MTLQADPKRSYYHRRTGIFVRAEINCKYDSFDIAELDKPSLARWLRTRGGNNEWAENVVALMLGHGRFSESDYEGAKENV